MAATKVEVNDILKHEYRKVCVYRAIQIDLDGTVHLRRVKKASGYPDGGYRSIFRVPKAQYNLLTVVAHHETQEDLSKFTNVISTPANRVASRQEAERQNAKSWDRLKRLDVSELKTAVLFGQVSKNSIREFSDILGYLSPEYLTCDGTLPRTQINKRLNELKLRWRRLEEYVGFKINESVIEDYLTTPEVKDIFDSTGGLR